MFRIGEFSHIAQVIQRLLYYYNEVGLLKPAAIDPDTGHFCYSAAQLPRLNRILVLKELGFASDQIETMLRDKISDHVIQRMVAQAQEADRQYYRHDGMQRLRLIEARLHQNQRPVEMLDVVLQSVPARFFLSIRATVPSPEALFQLMKHVQLIVPWHVDRRILGEFATITYTKEFTFTSNDVEVGYLLRQPLENVIELSNDYILRLRQLPAVPSVACTVQSGGPEYVFIALQRIAQWIETNGYHIAGPYREIRHAPPPSEPYGDMQIEVQMPVNPGH